MLDFGYFCVKMAAILNFDHMNIIGHYYKRFHWPRSLRVHVYNIMWCNVKMNTFCNLPGSRQPSWIFMVPTSCPKLAHCHLTDFSLGTRNLHDSAKNLRRPTISRFSTVQDRVATRLKTLLFISLYYVIHFRRLLSIVDKINPWSVWEYVCPFPLQSFTTWPTD